MLSCKHVIEWVDMFVIEWASLEEFLLYNMISYDKNSKRTPADVHLYLRVYAINNIHREHNTSSKCHGSSLAAPIRCLGT